MNAMLVAVALSLVSAVAYAAAAVAQERLAARDAGTGVRRMLASGAWWSSVALNAGAALFVAGVAETVKAGIAQAAAAIDSGKAINVLNQLVTVSNRGAQA